MVEESAKPCFLPHTDQERSCARSTEVKETKKSHGTREIYLKKKDISEKKRKKR